MNEKYKYEGIGNIRNRNMKVSAIVLVTDMYLTIIDKIIILFFFEITET